MKSSLLCYRILSNQPISIILSIVILCEVTREPLTSFGSYPTTGEVSRILTYKRTASHPPALSEPAYNIFAITS